MKKEILISMLVLGLTIIVFAQMQQNLPEYHRGLKELR